MWQYVQIKKVSNVLVKNEYEPITAVTIEKEEQVEKEIMLEDAKSEYSYIVENAINKKQPRAAWSECGNEYMYINIVAPKINIDTDNVNNVNNEIINKYSNMSIDTTKGGYNINVSYIYKHIPSRNLLFVLITERYEALCATGSIKYQTYIYDTKNDEFFNFEKLLQLYNITKNDLQLKAYEGLSEHIGFEDSSHSEELESYKNRVDDIINNEEMSVLDIEEDRLEISFPVDLAGMIVKI